MDAWSAAVNASVVSGRVSWSTMTPPGSDPRRGRAPRLWYGWRWRGRRRRRPAEGMRVERERTEVVVANGRGAREETAVRRARAAPRGRGSDASAPTARSDVRGGDADEWTSLPRIAPRRTSARENDRRRAEGSGRPFLGSRHLVVATRPRRRSPSLRHIGASRRGAELPPPPDL